MWGYDYAGNRYECSTHQSDKQAAVRAAREIERDRAVPTTTPQVNRVCTLKEAFDLLAAHDVRAGARPNTVDFHEDRAAHLLRILGAERLCDAEHLGLPELNAYTDRRLSEGAGRHTIQKEHRVLRQALGLAVQAKVCAIDPKSLKVAGFSKRRQYYQTGKRWLERAEYVTALLNEIVPYRRDDILLIVNLGVRRREPLTITPDRVKMTERSVRIEKLDEVTLKTEGSERWLPMNDTVMSIFQRRLQGARPGQALFTEWGSGNRDLQAAWTRARTKLVTLNEKLDYQLPMELSFTDLRRTCCSMLKNAGVSLETCADLLGHEDISMVRMVYGQASSRALQDAVAQLPTMYATATPDHQP